MTTFVLDLCNALKGAGATPFMGLFGYVWLLWLSKSLLSARYRPSRSPAPPLGTTVIVPVYQEPEALFRQALASVRANGPTELICVVDGGDSRLAELAEEYCDVVLRIAKSGKRAAIAAGLEASRPDTEVVVVLDSDTVWEPGVLKEMLRPFADPRVGGVTPRQAIAAREGNEIRRFADWLEDLRYSMSVPAQSLFGQVGCLAGRTIAYRRTAFEPAVERMLAQTVFGVPQHIGDDRVLTNELLRNGWRTVYQSTAVVHTDAPSRWRDFWRQQLRWARSSQRETVLSLGWLWRKPVALFFFLTDILTPLAVYGIFTLAIAHAFGTYQEPIGLPVALQVPLAYIGMLASIGLRQIPHFRRAPGDAVRLPLFVLLLTFVMVPVRLIGLATMFHQSWGTRQATPTREVLDEVVRPQSAHV